MGWLETLNNMNYRFVLAGDEGVANFFLFVRGIEEKYWEALL